MSFVLLRRRKLGRTSCREVSRLMQTPSIVIRNDRPVPALHVDGDLPNGMPYLVRWGTTSNIPEGYRVLNTAEAIHRVNDKTGFRRLMMAYEEANGIKLVPKTWFRLGDWASHVDPFMLVEEGGHLDLQAQHRYIGRPSRHAQGRNLHLITNTEHAAEVARRYGEGNYYISEYIPKVAEYRVFIVQGRAVWVAKKTPADPTAIAWNVARGGRFDVTPWGEWPLKAVKNAIIAFNQTGLDFGGVDVMLDAEGQPYILEINSAPSMTSPYRQECTAKAFDWIGEHGKATIPLIEQRGGYRKFIHPAVCNDAIIPEN